MAYADYSWRKQKHLFKRSIAKSHRTSLNDIKRILSEAVKKDRTLTETRRCLNWLS